MDKKICKVKKEGVLRWFMYLIPVSCTGIWGITAWTAYNCLKIDKEVENIKTNSQKKKICESKTIIEINKPENLTESEKRYLKYHPDMIKTGKGCFSLKNSIY